METLDGIHTLGDPVTGPADTDTRGATEPTSEQRDGAAGLDAVDLD